MTLKKSVLVLVILHIVFLNHACRQAAGDPKEASGMLTKSPEWHIDAIMVNNAVTFKGGKMIQQSGGIDFDRYMETVSFKQDGTFEGYFKGDSKLMLLQWKVNEKDITLFAQDNKGGAWTIEPSDVTVDSFVMKTRSTAYDYPRMTTIELKFKQK